MKKPIFILFTLAIFNQVSLGNDFIVITNKSSYKHTDTLRYAVFSQMSSCNSTGATAYVYIHDANQTIVNRQILHLGGEQAEAKISLMALDSGFYFVTVFGYTPGNTIKLTGNTVCIAVDLPDSITNHLDKRHIELIPECGKALINYTNRMIVKLQSAGGNPVSDKIYFRNQHQQLIAICQTSNYGWGTVDLPAVAGDSLWLSDTKKNLLSVIAINNDRSFSYNGFSIHIPVSLDSTRIQIRKGSGAVAHKVYLEVYEEEQVLAEIPVLFHDDTTVVNISLPHELFRNKLLKALLKNENTQIIATRYFASKHDNSNQLRDLFCKVFTSSAPFFSETSAISLNDALIAIEKGHPTAEILDGEEGFRLAFRNPAYTNTQVDYYIYNTRNEIIKTGSSFADSSGIIQITGCNFYGTSFIKFYLDKNEVTGFEEVAQGLNPGEMDELQDRFRKISEKNNRRTIIPSATQPAGDPDFKLLKNINLNVLVRNRIPELEKKYISNGLFRDHNSIQVNVEDDRLALNYSVTEYLVRKIPGLFIYNGDLRYRNGYVEIYIDEMYMSNILLNQFIQTNDIGYIKFFRNPISSGLQATDLGSAAKGNSYAGGIQGSLAIYTRKSATINNNQSFRNGLLVKGYANEKAPPEE